MSAGAPDLERVGLGMQAELVFKMYPSMVRAFSGIIAAAMGPLVPGDSILCADDASFYPALGDEGAGSLALLSALPVAAIADGATEGIAAVASVVKTVGDLLGRDAPELHYLQLEQVSESLGNKITAFDIQNAVEPSVASFREYDPDRPLTKLASSAVSNAPFGDDGLEALASAVGSAVDVSVSVPGVGSISASGAIGVAAAAIGAADGAPTFLEVYDHHAPMLFPKWSSRAARPLACCARSDDGPRSYGARAAAPISGPAVASGWKAIRSVGSTTPSP